MVSVFEKFSVDPTVPVPPEPGSVNPGYNKTMDQPRPTDFEEYLMKYDSMFLVDDSGSMSAENRWTEARAAMIDLANEAIQYDADGIGLHFFNASASADYIKGEDAMLRIIDTVSPGGGTPTGARIDDILGKFIAKLDANIGTSYYGNIKPLDLIVVTDGAPTDDPKVVLEKWAAHLDNRKHHPNAVGIQFVQIGNETSAAPHLLSLVKGNVRGMVDTIPYNGSFTPERLTRVLLGAIMPSIRVQQNARLRKP